MAQDLRKAELIAELDRSREQASAYYYLVRSDLDVKHHVETTFRRHSFAWITGASLFGFLLSKLPARTKKVAVPRGKRAVREEEKTVVKAGLLVTVLKLVFDILRPTLTKWLTRQVVAYAENRFGQGRRV